MAKINLAKCSSIASTGLQSKQQQQEHQQQEHQYQTTGEKLVEFHELFFFYKKKSPYVAQLIHNLHKQLHTQKTFHNKRQ